MGERADASLIVTLRDLPSVTVIFTHCSMNIPAGEFDEQIARSFHTIKGIASRYGHDPFLHKVIGVPHVADGRLTGYDCCAEVPHDAETFEGVDAKRLEGGRYAVLTLDKNPSTIGASIERFFSEYVPGHDLRVDQSRAGYEIYSERVMELCTPIR